MVGAWPQVQLGGVHRRGLAIERLGFGISGMAFPAAFHSSTFADHLEMVPCLSSNPSSISAIRC